MSSMLSVEALVCVGKLLLVLNMTSFTLFQFELLIIICIQLNEIEK